MPNKLLTRDDAPLEPGTWDALDRVMVEAAKSRLSGRRLLAIEGPYGLGLKAVPLSDPEGGSEPVTGQVLSLALISTSFTLAKRDVAAFESHALLLDTGPVAAAALECARQEDDLIFNGIQKKSGLLTTKGHGSLKLSAWTEIGTAANDIINAVGVLDRAGFYGPYTMALAPARYNLLLRRYHNGNMSELDHMKSIVTEGIVKASALTGGGVLVASGRQFASIIIGQDMTIGFIGPAAERLEFTISESLIPYIRQPEAVCILND